MEKSESGYSKTPKRYDRSGAYFYRSSSRTTGQWSEPKISERMEAELGCKTTVIITGGIAKFIAPMCKTPMIYDKDLIIKGLATLYRDNKRK